MNYGQFWDNQEPLYRSVNFPRGSKMQRTVFDVYEHEGREYGTILHNNRLWSVALIGRSWVAGDIIGFVVNEEYYQYRIKKNAY